jgi:hypothetical protein
MKIAMVFAVLAAVMAPVRSSGQAGAAPTTTPEACLPSTTLEELITALDAAVSGPGDKDRTCLRELVMADGRLSPMAKAADGSFAPHSLTVDGWIEVVKKRGSAAFYERQVKVSSEVYGHIAHLWSTYEVRMTPNGKAEIRGINSIQAVNDGKRWRVEEILWQAETPEEPVPARYLP